MGNDEEAIDRYREKELDRYLEGLDIDDEEAYEEYENAMADKADAERELRRERDNE